MRDILGERVTSKVRHKCTAERRRPVCEQPGAVEFMWEMVEEQRRLGGAQMLEGDE